MSKVLDYESSLQRMGDDHDLFREMVELLQVDAPALLHTLRQALLAGDGSTVHRTAHTLKGLASNFSAERAVAAAFEVEKLAKYPPSIAMDSAIHNLALAFSELLAALADLPPSSQLPSARFRSSR